MILKDFAYNDSNGIQVAFDWSIYGTPENLCIDFLTIQDMELFADEKFDDFVETDTCPYMDEVRERMVGLNLGDGIVFEEGDLENITHWFVNPEENVYVAVIEW